MSRIFLKIYKFFQRKKWLMYATLIGTAVIFAFFAVQIKFEENIFKLLPKTEKAIESGIAFSDIKIKDKLFIQFPAAEGAALTPSETSDLEEHFLENLIAKDSTTHYIDSYLYKLDNDDVISPLSRQHTPKLKSNTTAHSSRVHSTQDKLMLSLSNLLTNSFAGRIKQIEKDNDVLVATSSNSDSYTITFTSKKKVVKGYSSIVLTYDKTKLQLKKMKLEEWTGQVTTYELN